MTELEILTVLKQARISKKLSRETFSSEIDCNPTTLCNWEAGNTSVVFSRLLQWAKQLGFELIIQPIKK